MSIFLGDMLTDIIEQLENGAPKRTLSREALNLGAPSLPQLVRHAGDRNRTSPFAFTGNKFEFRAVGSSMSCAWPNTVINTIVAESLDEIATAIEGELAGKRSRDNLDSAVRNVLQGVILGHKRVLFDGDGYSEAWHAEAARRELPNNTNCPDALRAFDSERAAKLFSKYNVISEAELAARVRIHAEKFTTELRIEAETMLSMARTTILPACMIYQGELSSAVAASKNAGIKALRQEKGLHELDVLINEFIKASDELQTAMEIRTNGNPLDVATLAATSLRPAMDAVRELSDRLESIVDSRVWPLPTYRELLFSN